MTNVKVSGSTVIAAEAQTSGVSVVMKVTGSTGARSVSEALLRRLTAFTSLPNGWDGDEGVAISPRVTTRARRLAFDSLYYAPEPFVAPASDGTILLKWDLANGIEIECFVDESSTPDVVVIDHGDVREVAISNQEAVLSLLERLATQ